MPGPGDRVLPGVAVGIGDVPRSPTATSRCDPLPTGSTPAFFALADDEQDRIRANDRGSYDRLQQVKRQHDPDNVLRHNQNIAPA
jgi:hypothetical protein